METLESLMRQRRAAKAQVDHYLQECDGHPSILNPLSRVAYLSAVREEERLIDLLVQQGGVEGGRLTLYLVCQSNPSDLDWKEKIGEELGEVTSAQEYTKCHRCNTFNGCNPEIAKADAEENARDVREMSIEWARENGLDEEIVEHTVDPLADEDYEDYHGPDGLNSIETFWLVRLTLKWKRFQDHGDPRFWEWADLLGMPVECHVQEHSPIATQ